MRTILRVVSLGLALVASVVHADWETGLVPEGSTAATVERHAFRLNVVGKSAFGLSDSVELSSYLPLIICPNLGLKVRLFETPHWLAALEGDVAVGGFPLAGAAILPVPGLIAGGAAAGVAVGSAQLLEAHVGLRVTPAVTLSVRGGGFALEGAVAGAGVGAAVGGNGAAVVPLVAGAGNTLAGFTAGAELDAVVDPRNAVVVQGDVTGAARGPRLVLASASWIHAWDHFHLQLGLYAMLSVPMAEPPKLPVAPFVNVYWTFNRTPRG